VWIRLLIWFDLLIEDHLKLTVRWKYFHLLKLRLPLMLSLNQ
jgi:hypothetical protein